MADLVISDFAMWKRRAISLCRVAVDATFKWYPLWRDGLTPHEARDRYLSLQEKAQRRM